MINPKHYTYRVTWSPEDDEYVALCAEFPSLSYLSEDRADALANMVELVESVVEDMKDNGEKIPVPLADRKYSGKIHVRILPEVHRTLSIQAAEQGVSLNRYISAKLA
jgi:predicted HicB family RNase H-like nuclease